MAGLSWPAMFVRVHGLCNCGMMQSLTGADIMYDTGLALQGPQSLYMRDVSTPLLLRRHAPADEF